MSVEGPRRTAVLATLGTIGALVLGTVVVHPQWWTTDRTPWEVIAWCAAGASLGDAVHSRRTAVEAVIDRARQADAAQADAAHADAGP